MSVLENGRLAIAGDVGVASIAGIKPLFERCLAAGTPLAVDASKVERVDIAFVQLLLSARRGFVQAGLDFRVDPVAPGVGEAFRRAAIPAATTAAILTGEA